MRCVYIAGPFRGPTAWDIEQNIRRAEVLALEVAKIGAAPLCPHTNTRFFHGTLTDQAWLDITMELLCRCDAVLTTDDWERSAGARAEVSTALRCGTPVFQHTADLAEWIREQATAATR